MEILKDEIIYHVVTQKPMFVGQKIVFGDKTNSLFDRVNCWEFLNDNGEDCLEIIQKRKFYEFSDSDKKTLRTFIYEGAMISREYVLEQIRKEKYSDYPSRFKCLYCVREEKDAQIWIDVFNRMKRPILQLVKMKANGKIFDGDASKILRDARSLNHKIQLGEEYWLGAKEDALPESLFEGEVEVVEILKTF